MKNVYKVILSVCFTLMFFGVLSVIFIINKQQEELLNILKLMVIISFCLVILVGVIVIIEIKAKNRNNLDEFLLDDFGFDFVIEYRRYNKEKKSIKSASKDKYSDILFAWDKYVADKYGVYLGNKVFIRLLREKKNEKYSLKESSGIILIPVLLMFASMTLNLIFSDKEEWLFLLCIILMIILPFILAHVYLKWKQEEDFIGEFIEIIDSDECVTK